MPRLLLLLLLPTPVLLASCRESSTGPQGPEPPPPAQPLIAFVSDRDGNPEIYTMRPSGSELRRLTEHPAREQSPAWSPDRRWIVFVSDRDGSEQIYVMRFDGSGVRRLTTGEGRNSSPAWSPDGKRITFVSDRDGNEEIYLMNSDGTGAARLTHHAARDFDPAWSPDGKQIAFASSREEDYPALFVMNADGSSVTRLTSQAQFGRESMPAWSPDGGRIAFTCAEQICSRNADGTGTSRLTSPGSYFGPFAVKPVWSPDGSKIAFTSNREGAFPELYLMNADGSSMTRLTTNPQPRIFVDPAWSPDGSGIALIKPIAGASRPGRGLLPTTSATSELYVIDPDGRGLRKLVGDPAPADFGYPVWSPDGSRIAFRDFGGEQEIYVINRDGSGRINLTNHPALDRDPIWSPDGSEIAFVSARDGDLGIFVVRPDGSGLTRLSSMGFEWPALTGWSPDGARILFHEGFYAQVFTLGRVGGEITQLTSGPGYFSVARSARYSPDGSRIAFVCAPHGAGSPSNVCLMNSDGSERTQLTSSSLLDFFVPAWAPSGTRLAAGFWGLKHIIYPGVMVVATNGGGTMTLGKSSCERAYDPAWNPDGSLVAFTCSTASSGSAYPYAGHSELYLERLADGQRTRLTYGSSRFSAEPAWSR